MCGVLLLLFIRCKQQIFSEFSGRGRRVGKKRRELLFFFELELFWVSVSANTAEGWFCLLC